jgi:hypothetical protein
MSDNTKLEWCFAVQSDMELAEVRIRSNGEVVWTGGQAKWVCLDGISFPTSDWRPTEIVRNDVIQINNFDSMVGSPLDGKRYLFHYTKADTALTHILPSRRLRLSPYANLNDPRESKEWLFAVVAPEGALKPGQSLEIGRQMSDLLKSRSRVSCFCSDGSPLQRQGDPDLQNLSDTSGWAHASMWAHYAANHHGIVLVFDRRKLLENAVAALRSKGQLFFGNVLYVAPGHNAGLPPFLIPYNDWTSRSPETSAQEHLNRHRAWLFFTKNLDWAPENECRIVLHDSNEPYEHVPIDDALCEICIGEAVDNETMGLLKTFGTEFNATISRIVWRNGLPSRTPLPPT